MPAINAGLTAAAQVCADQAVQSFGSSPSPPGSPPGVDTGFLRNSIAAVSPEALGTDLRAAFGTAVAYGRHLEFGAIITPKNVQYLPVPVNRGLAQAIRRRIGQGASLRGYPGLQFIPRRGGGGVLVMKNSLRYGKNNKRLSAKGGDVAFVLKKQVRIAPRPWIRRAAAEARDAAANAARFVTTARLKEAGLVK